MGKRIPRLSGGGNGVYLERNFHVFSLNLELASWPAFCFHPCVSAERLVLLTPPRRALPWRGRAEKEYCFRGERVCAGRPQTLAVTCKARSNLRKRPGVRCNRGWPGAACAELRRRYRAPSSWFARGFPRSRTWRVAQLFSRAPRAPSPTNTERGCSL